MSGALRKAPQGTRLEPASHFLVGCQNFFFSDRSRILVNTNNTQHCSSAMCPTCARTRHVHAARAYAATVDRRDGKIDPFNLSRGVSDRPIFSRLFSIGPPVHHRCSASLRLVPPRLRRGMRGRRGAPAFACLRHLRVSVLRSVTKISDKQCLSSRAKTKKRTRNTRRVYQAAPC